jgi:hypothetical protein
MRNPPPFLSVAIACFSIVALGLLTIPAFGQQPEGSAPSPHHQPVQAQGHVIAIAVPPHAAPAGAPAKNPHSLAAQWEALKEQVIRFACELSLKLLSGNEANLLSGNSPKLLSENAPNLLSGNQPRILSGNQTPIFSGNRLSLFSGLKIEIHIENSGNHAVNPPPAPPRPAEKSPHVPQ